MKDVLIECRSVCKDYDMGSEVIHALRDVSLTISRGEYVAIMGPSGSGKSTLMNLIGALDVPTRGDLVIDGLNLSKQEPDTLADFRNHTIGFVFQQFNLLPKPVRWKMSNYPCFTPEKTMAMTPIHRQKHVWNGLGLATAWVMKQPNYPADSNNVLRLHVHWSITLL